MRASLPRKHSATPPRRKDKKYPRFARKLRAAGGFFALFGMCPSDKCVTPYQLNAYSSNLTAPGAASIINIVTNQKSFRAVQPKAKAMACGRPRTSGTEPCRKRHDFPDLRRRRRTFGACSTYDPVVCILLFKAVSFETAFLNYIILAGGRNHAESTEI